ncbi:MAG TPA: dTDP-4-dehydrorhamnose 3,5-epimerase [Longimicrobium sp.]|jgi:dTDP-4-dehydrorhamnose 3,5-epimerase
MNVQETGLPGVLLVQPPVFRDARGFFRETWRADQYAGIGITGPFVQDNVSLSARGVLRGLHFQEPGAQGKLVCVLRGEVWDVAVDVRAGSPTFGRWTGYPLSAENGWQLWIPEGFAHGFVVTSDEALFAYKCTAPYRPEAEGTVLWNDPDLGIEWPAVEPVVSYKDERGVRLRDIPRERLPRWNP